jgi:hypothetical protein
LWQPTIRFRLIDDQIYGNLRRATLVKTNVVFFSAAVAKSLVHFLLAAC